MHVISNFLWDKFPSSLLFIIKNIVPLVPQVVMLPHQFLYFLSAYHFFQAVASSRLVFLPPSPEFQGASSVFKAKQAAARLVDQVVGSTSPAPSFSRHLSVARLSFPLHIVEAVCRQIILALSSKAYFTQKNQIMLRGPTRFYASEFFSLTRYLKDFQFNFKFEEIFAILD
jgi:hypothetical protein